MYVFLIFSKIHASIDSQSPRYLGFLRSKYYLKQFRNLSTNSIQSCLGKSIANNEILSLFLF